MNQGNNKTGILIGVLVSQLALAVFLYSKSDPTAVFTPNETLITVNTDSVNQVSIESKTEDKVEKIELAKVEGTWKIPAFHNVPVSSSKVTTLLSEIKGFRKSYPVGQTTLSAKQFKVTEDAYERKVTLYTGEKPIGTIFLGTSPSFKKVYARVATDEKITYSVPFNNYEAPLKNSEWIDKDSLKVDMTKVSKLNLRDLELEQKGGDFSLTGLNESEQSNSTKVNSLAQSMLSPTFDDILGLSSETSVGPQRINYLVSLQNGEVLEYNFYAPAQTETKDSENDKKKESEAKPDHYILKVSNQPFAFKVPAYGIDKLTGANRSELVTSKETPAPSGEAGQEMSPSTTSPVDVGTAEPEDITNAETTGSLSP